MSDAQLDSLKAKPLALQKAEKLAVSLVNESATPLE